MLLEEDEGSKSEFRLNLMGQTNSTSYIPLDSHLAAGLVVESPVCWTSAESYEMAVSQREWQWWILS